MWLIRRVLAGFSLTETSYRDTMKVSMKLLKEVDIDGVI